MEERRARETGCLTREGERETSLGERRRGKMDGMGETLSSFLRACWVKGEIERMSQMTSICRGRIYLSR